jgi:hypothetical protein
MIVFKWINPKMSKLEWEENSWDNGTFLPPALRSNYVYDCRNVIFNFHNPLDNHWNVLHHCPWCLCSFFLVYKLTKWKWCNGKTLWWMMQCNKKKNMKFIILPLAAWNVECGHIPWSRDFVTKRGMGTFKELRPEVGGTRSTAAGTWTLRKDGKNTMAIPYSPTNQNSMTKPLKTPYSSNLVTIFRVIDFHLVEIW